MIVKLKILYTQHLKIRPLHANDKDLVYALIGDEQVRHFLGGPVPVHRRESVVADHFSKDDEKVIWTVEMLCSPVKIGLIYLSKHREEPCFELSYCFIPSSWRRGYAAEATGEVLSFAAQRLQMTRIVAETQSANIASCRLLEKLKMTELRRLQRFGAEQVIYTT